MAVEPYAERSEALRQVAADAPNYQRYRPLDTSRREIRVLDLEADLACTLRHVDLSTSPVYHALSYCWGPPGSTKDLTIKSHGEDETEIVQIRKTLAKFLKSLYKQYGRMTVWLDVICINQRSFAEQNAQVAMMGDIYRSAKGVYAWVGPWDPDIEYFFNFAGATSPNQLTSGFDLKKVTVGLELLFYRPYWTRVWIIQECVLNQQLVLVCGSLFISWEDLEDGAAKSFKAMKASGRPSEVTSSRFNNLHQARLRTSYVSDRDIIEEALRFEQAQCTDPHDKIYGFRAMATVGSGLHVDYTCKLFDLLIATVSEQNRDRFQHWQLINQHQVAPAQEWWKGHEQAPSLDMIGDGSGLSEMLSLGAREILVALQAQPTDWLVMPLRQAKSHPYLSWISLDETCGLTREEVSKTSSTYLVRRERLDDVTGNDLDLLTLILDDSRIVGLKHPGKLEGSNAKWTGQMWVCNVHRAIHFSRWLYAMFMAQGLRYHRASITRELESYSKSSPRATAPRHCGCDSDPTTPYPSPWPAKRDDAVQDKSTIS